MRPVFNPSFCRRITPNALIRHYKCLYKLVDGRINASGCYSQKQSSRTLFWVPFLPQSRDKIHDLPPGLKDFIDLSNEKQSKPTAVNHTVLIDALNSFFRWQAQCRKPLPESYAKRAWSTVQYLSAMPDLSHTRWLSTKTVRRALQVLTHTSSDVTEPHEKLARELLRMLVLAVKPEQPHTYILEAEAWRTLLKLMSRNGKTVEAQILLCEDLQKSIDNRALSQKIWLVLLQEYAQSGNEEGLSTALKRVEELHLTVSREMYDVIIQFYAVRDNIEKAKGWYKRFVSADNKPVTAETYSAILKCCSRTGELEWGNSITHSIAEGDMSREVWDAIFIWTAASGKGIEEIDRLMNLMTERGRGGLSNFQPTAVTINQLIEYSISRNDPYSAERFSSLGKRRNIQPNKETYTLQIIYRMAVNDLDGALVATKGLQHESMWSEKTSSAVNNLVQKMCISRKNDFLAIMGLVEQLSARRCPLKAKTVLDLCILHLERSELHEVIDLLKTYSFDFSSEERTPIRDVLVSYCKNSKNSTSQIWDMYMVCRHTFDTEVTRDIRLDIMQAFFQRSRPDMACYVFGHMRQHSRPEIRPTVDTYVIFLENIATCRDGEILEIVHSQLKLDATIDPNTRLLNALMLAYTQCDMAHRSIEFWDEIVTSREGPSYNSIRLIFQACERIPFGDRRAKSIWRRLIAMKIGIPKHIFAAYLGAIASHSRLWESLQVIEMGIKSFGYTPNVMILGTLFNATAHSSQQEEAGSWIKVNYPEVWSRLKDLTAQKADGGLDVAVGKDLTD